MAQDLNPGDRAADFSLPDANGSTFRLTEVLDKTLILYFIREFG